MTISEYRVGTIIWDQVRNQYDLYFGREEYYGGFLCGEPVEVLINNRWIKTRFEIDQDWYLVGIDQDILALQARVRTNSITY